MTSKILANNETPQKDEQIVSDYQQSSDEFNLSVNPFPTNSNIEYINKKKHIL